MEKPHYDVIRGLSPTISIEQKAASNNPRSTVGTITEIHDYLRVLYAAVGKQHCTICGRRVGKQSAQQIADELAKLPAGTKLTLPAPHSFSFNNPLGMCHECNGLGTRPEMDADLIVPDPNKSIRGGAVEPWNHALEKQGGWTFRMIESLSQSFKVPLDKPWKDLPRE